MLHTLMSCIHVFVYVYQNYLKYYGYLDSVNSVASSDRFHDPMVDLSPAIRRFQRFAGLPVTGERVRCQPIFLFYYFFSNKYFI